MSTPSTPTPTEELYGDLGLHFDYSVPSSPHGSDSSQLVYPDLNGSPTYSPQSVYPYVIHSPQLSPDSMESVEPTIGQLHFDYSLSSSSPACAIESPQPVFPDSMETSEAATGQSTSTPVLSTATVEIPDLAEPNNIRTNFPFPAPLSSLLRKKTSTQLPHIVLPVWTNERLSSPNVQSSPSSLTSMSKGPATREIFPDSMETSETASGKSTSTPAPLSSPLLPKKTSAQVPHIVLPVWSNEQYPSSNVQSSPSSLPFMSKGPSSRENCRRMLGDVCTNLNQVCFIMEDERRKQQNRLIELEILLDAEKRRAEEAEEVLSVGAVMQSVGQTLQTLQDALDLLNDSEGCKKVESEDERLDEPAQDLSSWSLVSRIWSYFGWKSEESDQKDTIRKTRRTSFYDETLLATGEITRYWRAWCRESRSASSQSLPVKLRREA
ncbi:hypothetical protein VNI00_002498 [Paramarasmius palmivorus]|uniref:Uncharacterized protein n=1 Tax=Paramarasmius palmivorus TaxID=297713 RepID=A0AAW0E004_9AGAR